MTRCVVLTALAAAAAVGQDSAPATRDRVSEALARVEECLASGDLARARGYADEARVAAPRDPRPLEWTGHVLYRIGEQGVEKAGPTGPLVQATFTDAGTAYEDAIALGGDAYKLGSWAADAHERGGMPEKALAAIERAIEARPGDAAALAVRGRLRLHRGDAVAALRDFDDALARAPATSEAAAAAAVGSIRALLVIGDRERLAARFSALTRGDPHGAGGAIYAAVRAAFLGTPAEDRWEAMLAAEDAVEPKLAVVAYYRAELAIRRHRNSEALTFADRYAALAPTDPEAHLLRAVALRKLGRLDEARVAAGKAYDRGPDHAPTREEFRFLAQAYYDAGRYREAAEIQKFVLHLLGTAQARHDLAILQLDSGHPDAAERTYREIVGDDDAPPSERARALNALGLVQRSRGRVPEAEASFRAAIDADPENLDARENLGILLIGAGRTPEGRAALEACVARDPLRTRSLYHLLRLAHPEVP